MSEIIGAVWSLVTSSVGLAAIAAASVPACGGLALRLLRHRI